jgi:hypothetical protein
MDSMRRHEVAKYGIIGRAPHSIGDPDPDRKRELGEVEIDLGTEQRRIAPRMTRKLAR